MKKYITPNIELTIFQMCGTLCSSVQPPANPENSGRPQHAAPARPF